MPGWLRTQKKTGTEGKRAGGLEQLQKVTLSPEPCAYVKSQKLSQKERKEEGRGLAVGVAGGGGSKRNRRWIKQH